MRVSTIKELFKEELKDELGLASLPLVPKVGGTRVVQGSTEWERKGPERDFKCFFLVFFKMERNVEETV